MWPSSNGGGRFKIWGLTSVTNGVHCQVPNSLIMSLLKPWRSTTLLVCYAIVWPAVPLIGFGLIWLAFFPPGKWSQLVWWHFLCAGSWQGTAVNVTDNRGTPPTIAVNCQFGMELPPKLQGKVTSASLPTVNAARKVDKHHATMI